MTTNGKKNGKGKKKTPAAPAPAVDLIHGKIAAIQADIGAIAKEGRNDAQKYNFRGIDQVYDRLHPMLVRHGVFVTSHVVSHDRQILDRFDRQKGHKIGHSVSAFFLVDYIFHCAEDGSTIKVGPFPGEAMDTSDKASIKAMSLAYKGAILQTFSIPLAVEADFGPDDDAPDPAGQVDDFLDKKRQDVDATADRAQGKTPQSIFCEQAQAISDRDCKAFKLGATDITDIAGQIRALAGHSDWIAAAAWLKVRGKFALLEGGDGEIMGVKVSEIGKEGSATNEA